ncbi:MAG: hypothetical protein HPY59_16985 [Anaerolineae bacterium]|nr:hypothetical protein [Anaerolineae bacterium]
MIGFIPASKLGKHAIQTHADFHPLHPQGDGGHRWDRGSQAQFYFSNLLAFLDMTFGKLQPKRGNQISTRERRPPTTDLEGHDGPLSLACVLLAS